MAYSLAYVIFFMYFCTTKGEEHAGNKSFLWNNYYDV